MSSTSLQTLDERGWLAGFANLLRKENGAWWRTRRWLIQSLIWFCVLNGLLAMILWATPQMNTGEARQAAREAIALEASAEGNEEVRAFQGMMQNKPTAGVFIFLMMSGLAVPIAATIAGQDVLITEKHSGTAAWVLSKPVSRPAFILTKLFANGLGFLTTTIVVQGALAYLQISLAAGAPRPVLAFAGGLGLVYLNLMFYFTLAVMLGTFFNGRGPVLGIPLALLLGYQLWLGIAPQLALVGPWALVLNVLTGGVPISVAVALGMPLPSVALLPIIATAVWCVIFSAVALWRFQREEF